MSNPTTLVESFDGSLGSFAGVDPIRYNSELWLEEATVNYNLESSFEATRTYWGAYGASTITPQSTEQKHSGAYSAKAVTTAAGQGIYANSSPGLGWVAGQPTTISGWIYAPVGAQIGLYIQHNNTDASSTASVLSTFTGDGGWKYFSVTRNVAAGKTLDRMALLALHASGYVPSITFYVDDVQFENKAYATSFARGSLGSGYAFAGTADLSNSTRAASSASLDPTGILDPASGAIAFRATPTIETGLEEIWGECGVKGAGTDHLRWGRDASKHPFVEWSSNNAAYQRLTGTETISVNTEYLFYLGWNGVLTELSIDAGTKHTGTRDVVEDDFSVDGLTLEASAGGVIVSPFATFDRPLTDTEIATLAARQGWSMSTLDSTTRRIRAQFELRPAY